MNPPITTREDFVPGMAPVGRRRQYLICFRGSLRFRPVSTRVRIGPSGGNEFTGPHGRLSFFSPQRCEDTKIHPGKNLADLCVFASFRGMRKLFGLTLAGTSLLPHTLAIGPPDPGGRARS